MKTIILLLFTLPACIFHEALAAGKSDVVLVKGNNFSIPEAQEIDFVPLIQIDPQLYDDPNIPSVLNLRETQSRVRSQGNRGACTYFAFTSLIESLLKKTFKKEFDLSEEYLAWAGKVKMKLRIHDEGSSVAVNAATFQKFGFMLEKDMPYQPSWFDAGYPCEGLASSQNIDSICFSHRGPDKSKPIYDGYQVKFEAVGSRSIDIVRALAKARTPVTLSLIGHRKMWDESKDSGDFFLSAEHKADCQENRKMCGGHAVLAVGYDLNRKVIFFKNSWGVEWGNDGYGTIQFDYLDQMSERKLMTGMITPH